MFQLNPAPLDSENNNLSESKLYKKSNNKTIKNKKNVEFDESNITDTKNKITSLGNLMSKIHENNEEDENYNTNYQSNTIDESISTSFTDSLNEQLAKIQKMREAGNNIPQNNFFNNDLQNSNSSIDNISNISNSKNNVSNLENSDVLNNTTFSKNNLSNYSDSYKLNYNASQNTNTHNYDNNSLLSKLDYIIHLLEEQHNEKTNYITEELILYLFLGIFILFVLDSFARASKYVR